MIQIVFMTIIVLFLSACSFVKEPNEWEKKSSINLQLYTENFLSDKNLLAKSSLQRAITSAKQSDDLTTLAKIYLSECALNIAVGIADSCQKYENIEELVASKPLYAYKHLLQKTLKREQIKDLPYQYREFAHLYVNRGYPQAVRTVLAMEKTSSMLICAALMKEHLDVKKSEQIVKRASLYGYKKAILFWLDEMRKKSTDSTEKKQLAKKIQILKSKD